MPLAFYILVTGPLLVMTAIAWHSGGPADYAVALPADDLAKPCQKDSVEAPPAEVARRVMAPSNESARSWQLDEELEHFGA